VHQTVRRNEINKSDIQRKSSANLCTVPKDCVADVEPSTSGAIIGNCKSRVSIKSKEVGCRCPLILVEQVRLLCGFFLIIIFFDLIGDPGEAVTT
jgi:hypothetical protein